VLLRLDLKDNYKLILIEDTNQHRQKNVEGNEKTRNLFSSELEKSLRALMIE
jgi:hypothetical protein